MRRLTLLLVATFFAACSSNTTTGGGGSSGDGTGGGGSSGSSSGGSSPSPSSSSSSAAPPGSNAPPAGSGSSGSTAPWYCAENADVCVCYDKPGVGYDKPTCTNTSYACCATAKYDNGTSACACSTPCRAPAEAPRVPKCPP